MANMNFKANILPATSQGYNLGSSTQQWVIYGPIHSNGIYGTENVDYGATLPASATEGQIFFQTSNTVVYSVPAGGQTGYALVKDSNADGDFSWQEIADEIPVPLEKGGTSATNASGARTNLGLGNAKIFYGVCSTAAGTTAKAVTCADFTSSDLIKGTTVIVNMTNTNSGAAGDLTLSVNGTTAKPIRYQYNASTSAIPAAGYLLANKDYIFCYDGTNWVVTNIHYNTNTTYSNMSVSEMHGGTATNQRTLSSTIVHAALAGLGGTGLTFAHNITEGMVLNHSNVVTAKTAYASAATTANSAGGSITVTDIKYDTEGHITSSTDRTITLGLVAGYGDTTNPYATKTANYVLAAPNGSNGVPSFRALAAADIPSLAFDKITGTLPINRGGTGKTVATSAWAALGGGSAGKINLNSSATTYLSGSGTWTTPPGTYVLPAATANAIGGVKVSTSSNGLLLNAGDLSVDWSKAPVQSVNGETGTITLRNLNIGTKSYNGSSSTTITAADLGLASPMHFVGVTDSNITDNSPLSPINITSGIVPVGSYIPANSDVVLQKDSQMEFIYDGTKWHQLGIASSYSLAEHSHGYISNDGTVQDSTTVSLADRLIIADADDGGRLIASNFTFDGTSTQSALSKSGTWVDYLQTAGGTMTGAVKTNGLIGTMNVDYGDILPATASEGQLFFQVSYGDNDFALPAGGTAGYALVKNSNADGDIKWALITANDRVLKAGDTMTGSLTVAPATTAVYITAQGASGVATTLHVGSGGVNRGVYDNTTGKWLIYCDGTVARSQMSIYGAVWNDYAEFRQSDVTQPGRVVKENGDDTLSLTSERLERGCEIISDTFGFAIGETDKAKTPTAATGRVLAYPYEDRDTFKDFIGWPVCSGPNGTVSIMTEKEEIMYPSRIIGTISAVPDYAIWFGGANGDTPVRVDGRVWIRVR